MKASKMNRRKFTQLISFGSASAVIITNIPTAIAELVNKPGLTTHISDQNDLIKGFRNLPKSAKPWAFWMWLDGNVSHEGISADLEAFKKIGVGGVVIMNLGLPPNEEILPGPVRFMSAEWRDMVHHAVTEATRLGLEIDMNNDDGWNSGGPWITPELAMQKLTWSEKRVAGPIKFSGQLEQPQTKLKTYQEVAVLAIPAMGTSMLPKVVKTTVQRKPDCWLQLDYGQNVSAKAITISNLQLKPDDIAPKSCELLVSEDGNSFRSIRKFETGWLSATAPKSTTIRLGNVSGRFFRLLMPNSTIDPNSITFDLEPDARLDHWQMKAGFTYIREHGGGSPLYAMPDEFPKPMKGMFPEIKKVVDLSQMIRANGALEWDVPQGEWLILRIGYTPTGGKNGYATKEGSGLDCDKLSSKSLEVQLSGMVDKVLDDAGSLVGKGLTSLHTDSWESGATNWTASFPQEFKKRRGYDIIPWLPVMTGQVIGSVDQSERFLWDVRRTIADMFMDNHLKHFQELSHKKGLRFSSESAGRQQFLYDPISFQVCSDLPMGEFWNIPQEARPRPDCKAAASAAHVANRPIAGAEAFTQNRNNAGTWLETPFSLKAPGDSAFCFGINRLYFCHAVLQPNPGNKPGMAWPHHGINFDTTQTWWEPASAWIDYLTRSQYLLQQGRFVADVAVLTDEGAPSSVFRQLQDRIGPDDKYDTSTFTESVLRRYDKVPFLPPFGYDYDFVNAQVIQEMYIREGRLTLPHGMSYKVLVLPPGERMTLKLLRKIRELVNAGATIVGNRPKKSPTLSDYPQGDIELLAITRELWGDDNNGPIVRQFGQGRVFKGNSTLQALETLQTAPDFEYTSSGQGHKNELRLDFIHRQTDTADIYFVSNQRKDSVKVNCTFRIADRLPEIWLPDTGKIFDCTAFEQRGTRTTVPLHLDPSGSLFVVFRKPVSNKTAGISGSNFPVTQPVETIDGGWTVHFDTKWGGPEKYQMEGLQSWTQNQDEGIKFYSGTATYKKQIEIKHSLINSGKPLYLDLGSVKEIARVRLNGKDLGVLWKPPFLLEITTAARVGKNLLEIEVTNLWPNRLIADAALPNEKRLTRVNWNPYKPDSQLLESGLIGPVTLQTSEQTT